LFNLKKGHRPPPAPVHAGPMLENGPKPGEPGWHEPYVEGFDAAAWESSESLRSSEALRYELFYKYKDEMDPGVLTFWAERGVRKQMFDTEREGGEHRWSLHTPLELEAGRLYPLIYYCHGGMQDPFQAECCGLSLLIEREKFFVVYAHNGGRSNETAPEDFKAVTDALKAQKQPVDWSRVYAAGFSSGSDAVESIATLWPELVAAVSPCPGSNALYNSLCRVTPEAYEKCLASRVPALFIGGTADFGDKYPLPDPECVENFNIWAQSIARVRDYAPIDFAASQALAGKAEKDARSAVGLDFHRTFIQRFEERNWYIGDFLGQEGVPVIRFVVGEGVPHVVTGCHAPIQWDFFRHWSKDPITGKSRYDPISVTGVE